MRAASPLHEAAAKNALLQYGYLDVTKTPYGADATGVLDSTQAVQRAVNDARDRDLVCFFPAGTYLVSDSILGMRKCVPTTSGGGWRVDNHQCILVGSSTERPVIKLKVGDPGFQTPKNPKPVLWLYSMSAYEQQRDCEGSTDPECGQANINFNRMVRSIDLDLGGNPGAVGICHAGAQGVTIEDVRINAAGAFAGLYNPPGQAGGTYNIEIEGGDFGVYIAKVKNRHQARHTLISGCVFKNQKKAVFHVELFTPAIVSGFRIVKDSGPINTTLPEYDGLSRCSKTT